MPQAPRPIRNGDWDTVIREDLRPAGNGKDCFFCHQPLGKKHTTDCVIRQGAGQYLVAIRCNATGEIRMYRYDMTWEEEDGLSMFMWTGGNMGCDCNRHNYFKRAAGEDDEDIDCGDTAYTCLFAELPDGRRIPIQKDN